VAAIQNANKVSSRAQTICGSAPVDKGAGMGGKRIYWQQQIQNIHISIVCVFVCQKQQTYPLSVAMCAFVVYPSLSRRWQCMGECL